MESPRNQGTVLSFDPPQSLVVVGWVEMQALPQLYRIKISGPRLEVGEDYIFTNISRKFGCSLNLANH